MNDFEYVVQSHQFGASLIGEHWLWGGARNNSGYGCLGRISIHRASFEHFHRKLAPDEVVRHTCDTPLCFNPAHLLSGSRSDNSRDTISRGRGNTQKLTADEIREIRSRYVRWNQGKRVRSNAYELAAEYGVCRGYVKAIIARRVWEWA